MDGDGSISPAAGNDIIEDDEFVWDGFFHAEQLKTIPVDDDYANLMFAARIGQKLLQRNGELKSVNYQLQYCNEEQRVEIEHLTKQLAWLREVNESKARMFEQLDINHQELETSNKKLKAETKEWRERLTKYMDLCENREDEIMSLKAEIKSLRNAKDEKSPMNFRRRTVHGYLPRKDGVTFHLTSSFSRSSDLLHKDVSRDQFNSSNLRETEALQQVIVKLKSELAVANKRNDELQKDVDALLQDAQDWYTKFTEEREMSKKMKGVIDEYDKIAYEKELDVKSLNHYTLGVCDDGSCSLHGVTDKAPETEKVNPISNQEPDKAASSSNFIPTLNCEVPISQYLHIASSTPARPSPIPARSKPLSTPHTPKSPNLRSGVKSEPRNMSLLQEMDTQYKFLLGKYETLLKNIESERCSFSINESTQQQHSIERSECAPKLQNSTFTRKDNADKNLSKGDSSSSVPEYKRLFREIFTLISDAKM